MRSVSDDFQGMLRISHLVSIEATIEAPGQPPVMVEVSSGHVTLDRTASVRRRGSVVVPYTIAPDAETPIDVPALPFGAYVVLKRGVRFGDGTRELVTLGRLRVDAVSSRSTEGTASIELSDRMAQIADSPLLQPFVPTTGATTAIRDLVYEVFGDQIAYHLLTDVPAELPLLDASYTEDRVKAIEDLARSVNAEAYFDAEGDLVVAPLPELSGAPVWTVDAGESGVLIDVDETLDRTETINGVLVVGQPDASAAPVTALVTDDDPDSATRWGGPFGKIALRIESTAIQTEAQATEIATNELANRLGLSRSLVLTTVPNPALEPGDIVRVVFPRDQRTEDHLVESLTVPLEASAAVELLSRALLPPVALRATHNLLAWQEYRLGQVAA